MNTLRLLLFTIIISACNSPQSVKPDKTAQYYLYLRYDSLAKNNPDSAFSYYFNASEKLVDSTYKGMAFQSMADIQHTAEDYNGSNESAILAIAFFGEKNEKRRNYVSFNYNLLGTNCLNLQRYEDAFRYYDLAITYADKAKILYYKNNKGVAYQKVKQYDSAISLFEDVLRSPGIDTLEYARSLSNLGKSRWLKNSVYHPTGDFHMARQLRELKNDQLGLNASYSHLADYYMKSRPDSAFYYAEKMYVVATSLGRADDQAEALQKLADLSSSSNFNNYFSRYLLINDSINFARSNERNQFADIRFNFEQARADNLVLEKDNSQKRFRIARQRFIIYGTTAFFFLLFILGINWYQKRKRLQDLQTKTAIRESELRTSQKVHDVVANGLYRIMTDLEHHESIEKEKLLDNIEELYEQSRDISYESTSPASGSFASSLNRMLSSFATAYTRVLTVGNNEEVWKDITPALRRELEAVLQELMVNMKKHSQAKNVVLNFQRLANAITIRYKDDGIGLPSGYRKGNGMSSTENRISATGGTVIFDSVPDKGLTIDISIPSKKTL